jgi:hypothetical protein
VSRQRRARLGGPRPHADLPGRAGLRPGGAERVAQRPQRRADQHQVLEQELAGQHRQHREPAGGRRGDPGVVNRKLSVPANSSTPNALPAAEIRGQTGRSAISSAAMISAVPSTAASARTLKM